MPAAPVRRARRRGLPPATSRRCGGSRLLSTGRSTPRPSTSTAPVCRGAPSTPSSSLRPTARRWPSTPPTARSCGSTRRRAATPVADPDRAFVYAASPDGQIHKLAVADGRAAWSSAITDLPRREKIASPLNYFRGRVIATTGGYIGDASPYQGHVAILDAANGKLLHVWNSLCSDRPGILDPASCSESGSAIWGRAGAVIDSTTGNIFVATGNGLWDGRAHWGDAVLELDADATRLLGNYTPTNTAALDARDAH